MKFYFITSRKYPIWEWLSLDFSRLAAGLANPFYLIARTLGYKYDIFPSPTVSLEILSRPSSAVRISSLDMDKNKNEHSRGDPPVTSQHHTEDKALSLQDKVSCDQKALTTHLLADHLALIEEPSPGSRSSRRGAKKPTRYCDLVPPLAPLYKKILIFFPWTIGASSIGSGHGFFRMQIDENSRVFNGDARGKRPDGTQLHMISGGSVKNKSTLINGDLDPEIFREIFGKDR